jgi:hypothetical protein
VWCVTNNKHCFFAPPACFDDIGAFDEGVSHGFAH